MCALDSREIMRVVRAVRARRDSAVTAIVPSSALVDEAARVALFTLHATRRRTAEIKTATGARARALRGRQLVRNLQKQIDRLPTPDYPGGRELVVARARAKDTLDAWAREHLAPLEQYEPGLVVAPVLVPQSSGGAPRKHWLEMAGRAAGTKSAGRVAEDIIRAWRAAARLPATHPNHCSVDDLCALLIIPKARRQTAVDADVAALAREYLTERIRKAADRHGKKPRSR